MKKIKNKFYFPSLTDAKIDDAADELAVVVEMTIGDMNFLVAAVAAHMLQQTNVPSIKHTVNYYDVLHEWRSDLLDAWPYRKKKAHEQYVANKKKREKMKANNDARMRRLNDAGWCDSVAHPLDPDEHDVTIYKAKPADIDTDCIYAIVCSLHGSILETNNMHEALTIMRGIADHCTQCRDMLAETPEKTA